MTTPSDRLAEALKDRYTLERELGRGGMAAVYLAEDRKHDRKVAIKVLKPELAAVLGAERFVQEIKTTAALSHPHILPLFDSERTGEFVYYVMPYLEGETLREKLNRERGDGQMAGLDGRRRSPVLGAQRAGVVLQQQRRAGVADGAARRHVPAWQAAGPVQPGGH